MHVSWCAMPVDRVYRIFTYSAFKKEMEEFLSLDDEAILVMWNTAEKIVYDGEVCVQWVVREVHTP